MLQYGNTALILAASNGHQSVVELLIKAGASHIQNNVGVAYCIESWQEVSYHATYLTRGVFPELPIVVVYASVVLSLSHRHRHHAIVVARCHYPNLGCCKRSPVCCGGAYRGRGESRYTG